MIFGIYFTLDVLNLKIYISFTLVLSTKHATLPKPAYSNQIYY